MMGRRPGKRNRPRAYEPSTPITNDSTVTDMATTVENAEFIRDRVPGAKLIVLDAAHISNIEQADKYMAAALEFFSA